MIDEARFAVVEKQVAESHAMLSAIHARVMRERPSRVKLDASLIDKLYGELRKVRRATTKDLADAMGADEQVVRVTLYKLRARGDCAKVGRGLWACAGAPVPLPRPATPEELAAPLTGDEVAVLAFMHSWKRAVTEEVVEASVVLSPGALAGDVLASLRRRDLVSEWGTLTAAGREAVAALKEVDASHDSEAPRQLP